LLVSRDCGFVELDTDADAVTQVGSAVSYLQSCLVGEQAAERRAATLDLGLAAAESSTQGDANA